MAQFTVSAAVLGQLRNKAARAAEASGMAVALDEGPQMLGLEWLAHDGETVLGEPFTRRVEAEAPVEAFRPSGEIENILEPVGLELDADAPDGAGYLRVSQGEVSDTLVMSALGGPDPLTPEEDNRYRSDTARFVFPVFAERFTESGTFFAAVEALYEWIIQLPPFNEDGMKERFALHGYFWSTDPVRGQFNTRDISYNCADAANQPAVTFNGNNADARSALKHLMHKGKYGLVLINSNVRGGAGGLAEHGYPAWASIKPCPGERWEAVALHEIGHALGLADEYLDSRLRTQSRDGEPNCAASRHDVPWAVPAGTPVVDQAAQRTMRRDGPPGLDHVGLFVGARYREDYYRPSFDCLMNHTDCLRFCNVCREAIRRKLTGVQ